jgi:hypothetical protein
MLRVAATVSVVLGVLAIALVIWFPTGALGLGVIALVLGVVARSRLADGTVIGTIGTTLGALAVLATIVLIVATTRGDAPDNGTPAANVLSVHCGEGGFVIQETPVELQPDGLHVEVVNDSGDTSFYMRDPERLQRNVSFDLQRGRITKAVVEVEPGAWVGRCVTGGFDTSEVPLSMYSRPFRIVVGAG